MVNDTLTRMNPNELPKPIPISSPEQEPRGYPRTSVAELSPAHAAQAPEWLEKYANEPEAPKVSAEECEQKRKELEELLVAFETTYPVAEFYAITELDEKDLFAHPEKYPVRIAARQILNAICKILAFLPREINGSTEKYDALQARYKYLNRALGIINNGKVDHTR